jgi:hypothetical protein
MVLLFSFFIIEVWFAQIYDAMVTSIFRPDRMNRIMVFLKMQTEFNIELTGKA